MRDEQLLAEAIAHLPEGFRLDYELNADRASVNQDGLATLVSPNGLPFFFSLNVKKNYPKESHKSNFKNKAKVTTASSLALFCN